jgi:hypothetical protein
MIYRLLNPTQSYKPLDFGNGLLAGSVAPNGCLLSLSTYHPRQGYVVLSAIAPLPDDQRHNQATVRAYRAALAQPDAPTFGLRSSMSATTPEVYMLADAIPQSRWRTDAWQLQVTTWAPHLGDQVVSGAFQQWQLSNSSDQALGWDYQWAGQIGLIRASYTQLTERGHVPLPEPNVSLTFDSRRLHLVAPDAGAAAVILGLPAGPSWQQHSPGPLPVEIQGYLTIPPGQTIELTLIFALGQTVEQAYHIAAKLADLNFQQSLAATLKTRQARWQALDSCLSEPIRSSNLVHRAQTYILDCCGLPVEEGMCLLTDHQILPLSWTRDAYFLLQGLAWQAEPIMLHLTRRHLIWLFEIAHRPHGYWGRAYLANGWPKDQIFQLDQQCYPLLELAEYMALTADDALFERLSPYLPAVVETILARQATNAILFATEETPADDPMPLPYHFSSQILLWHTLHRLSVLNTRQPFSPFNLVNLSEAIRSDVLKYMVVQHQGQSLFAYATDLQGHYHFYHDANDLPTILAPLWGFCGADDPIWRATMTFAFSSANEGGYYPGSVGGLGSVHTPGAWPLGDVQELLYARLTSDASRVEAVLDRLVSTACWEGSLPEARDPINGTVRSRHWFGWPGAALVAALITPSWQP